jgi:hypothetical protein
MPKFPRLNKSPWPVAGANIPVTLTADQFWNWEYMVKSAREKLISDPSHAAIMLDSLSIDLAKVHAFARHDDPHLPAYYKRLVDE